nr:tetratricopeptide repeat protein [Candidatus Omnitrophota bacterium]
DYDIVHFAGHCGFDRRDPGQSGWVLRDGLFSITDIFSLGETSALPSLIFSNACTSALFADSLDQGRCQEQAFGIASAFLFSGVRHYIGSVQKIEDKASLDFAQAFYQGLLAGESVGQSLRKGRLALIKEHGFAYTWWASYLLYGDPGYVVFPQKAKMPEACSVSQFKRVGIALASAALVSLLLGLSAHVVLSKTKPAAYIRLAQARHLYSQGKNAESIALAQAIINNDPGFRPAYRILAEAYERIGDRQNAIRHYFDYAVLSERAHDTANLLDAYLGIGWLYHAMGNFEKAFEFYDKTLTVSKAKSAILHQAVALRKMAVWYIDQENYDKAMELLLKSSQINRERQHSLEHRYHLACDYFDIGLVFSNKDDFAAAKEFYAKSQKLFSSLRQKNELSDYYFNMGELYLFEKEYQNALGCYQKGLAIDKLHGNKPNLASGYDMLGELFVEMDDFTQAEHSFKQAIAISEAIDAPQELASAHYNLGLLYKRLNKKNRAREQLRLAQEIYSISNPASYQEVKEELLSLDK